jgi:hypothetical protein
LYILKLWFKFVSLATAGAHMFNGFKTTFNYDTGYFIYNLSAQVGDIIFEDLSTVPFYYFVGFIKKILPDYSMALNLKNNLNGINMLILKHYHICLNFNPVVA